MFDNMKALLIFCVVFAHFLRISGHFELGSPSRVIYILCFTFMMEGFFFISGFFSQNVDKCRAKACESLLLPYVVFMILSYFARLIIFGGAHFDLLLPSHAMWFLLVMFYYRFGIKTFAKIPFVLPLSAILFFAAGAMSFLGPYLALERACSFLVFFLLGYYCKWEHIEKIRRIPKPLIFLMMAILVAISIWYAGQRNYVIGALLFKNCYAELGIQFFDGVLTRFVVGMAALVWLAIWINLLPNSKLPRKGGLISQIGQNTMTVFLLHVFVRQILKWAGRQDFAILSPGGFVYVLVMLVLSLACVYVFSRPVVAKAYDKSMHVLYIPFGKIFSYIGKICGKIKP